MALMISFPGLGTLLPRSFDSNSKSKFRGGGCFAHPSSSIGFGAIVWRTKQKHGVVACMLPMDLQLDETEEADGAPMKTIFVAGSTGATGTRIVRMLLSHGGFRVRAGVLDIHRATGLFPPHPNLQIVKADVTQGSQILTEALADSEAVICATGFRRSFDPFAPWKVDNLGTVNLVEACRVRGVNRFILVSSILVNGAQMGQIFNPAYVILNLFGLTLLAKLQAERHIRKSGVNFTIIRPGGLKNDDSPSGENVVMKPEDTLYQGSISRDQLAQVAVQALLCPQSYYKVLEIISTKEAPQLPFADLFDSVPQA